MTNLALSDNEISDFSVLNHLANLEDLKLSALDSESIHEFDNLDLSQGDGNVTTINAGGYTFRSEQMTGSEYLDNITVTSPKPITYTIIDRFGNELTATSEPLAEGDNFLQFDFSGDFATPGDYDVVFNDTDGNKFTAIITITDVLPTLSIDNESVTLPIGSSLDDILGALTYSATEITDGDLTSVVTIDDSAVDYSTEGSYDIVFTVTDEEGNEVSKTVTVTIADEDSEIIAPVTPDTDSDTSVAADSEEVDSEEINSSTEDISENKQMSLATTGSNVGLSIVTLLVIIVGLLGAKKFTKES